MAPEVVQASANPAAPATPAVTSRLPEVVGTSANPVAPAKPAPTSWLPEVPKVAENSPLRARAPPRTQYPMAPEVVRTSADPAAPAKPAATSPLPEVVGASANPAAPAKPPATSRLPEVVRVPEVAEVVGASANPAATANPPATSRLPEVPEVVRVPEVPEVVGASANPTAPTKPTTTSRLCARAPLPSRHSMASEVVCVSANPVAPAKPAPTWSRAYVTLVAGNGDSVQGVVGLVKGLRKVKSTYPLVVAVLPDVPADHRRILKEQGCRVREIKPVCPQGNQTPLMADYFINYSKLGIWEFVQYSKMVYLDGNMQVYENIDHLFDMEDGHFYAVLDCFCERTWSHTPQYAIGYCQQCPDKVQWRDEMGPPPSPYFDDSMFVFEPNLTTYNGLLNTLRTTPPTSFAQQDFLNMCFRHIYKPLPLEYNLPLSMLWRHPEKVDLEEAKVVHYCEAGSKPWMYTWQEETGNMQREGIKMWVKKWWDIYEDKALDYKNWIWRPRKRPGVSTGNLASGPNKRSAK